MVKDTIVFINIFPLGSVFADSLGMELLSQAGYKLVYLDLKKIYYPETYKTWGKENIEYELKSFLLDLFFFITTITISMGFALIFII